MAVPLRKGGGGKDLNGTAIKKITFFAAALTSRYQICEML